MFDVGFSEILMVAIVALVVLGPERLPKFARAAGLWLGRARRSLAAIKQEIDLELKAAELKETLERQTRRDPLESILDTRPESAATTPRTPATPPAPSAPPTSEQKSG